MPFTHLIDYFKDSLDTGQIEDGFCNTNQSSDQEVHTLYLAQNIMRVATIYSLNGILVRNLFNLHSSGRKAQVSSLPKQNGSDRIFTTKLG